MDWILHCVPETRYRNFLNLIWQLGYMHDVLIIHDIPKSGPNCKFLPLMFYFIVFWPIILSPFPSATLLFPLPVYDDVIIFLRAFPWACHSTQSENRILKQQLQFLLHLLHSLLQLSSQVNISKLLHPTNKFKHSLTYQIRLTRLII